MREKKMHMRIWREMPTPVHQEEIIHHHLPQEKEEQRFLPQEESLHPCEGFLSI